MEIEFDGLVFFAPSREKHGARPSLPPGSLVMKDNFLGIVMKAETNIDGSCEPWSVLRPGPTHFKDDLTPYPPGHSHAWRPQYSVHWFATRPGSGRLRGAWWRAHEFDAVRATPLPSYLCEPWPALNLQPTDGDCAKAAP